MSENMRDMTLNLIVNSQVGKLKVFNQELNKTEQKIAQTETKVGWLGKTFRRVFGAYLGIQGAKDLINTYRQIDMVRRSLNALTGSAEMGAKHFEFIKRAAFQTGTGIMEVAKAYRGYYYAAKTAGLADEELQHSFLGVMVGARVLGANKQQVGGAMLALEQMLNKQTVQAQELNLQLGNAISGAKEMAAEAMGMSVPEFVEKMQKKMINSAEFVRKFGDYMYKQFINKLPEAMKSLDASLINLENTWILFKEEIVGSVKGSMGQSLIKLVAQIMKLIQSDEAKVFAQTLGKALGLLTQILSYLIQNIKTILFLLAPAMLEGALVKIIGAVKSLVAWITAGNLQLTATQKALFRIFLFLVMLQELIAFFTPMDGALETAILGKDQSWIKRLAYIAGLVGTIWGFLGFKGIDKIGKLFGIGTGAKGASGIAETTSKVKTVNTGILDKYGKPITRQVVETAEKTGGKGLAKAASKGTGALTKFGLKSVPFLGELLMAGEVAALGNASLSKIGINPMTASSYGFAMPYTVSSPQLNKTETIAPNITYAPNYKIDATTMTPEQLKAVLDERDRNFWTKLANPISLLKPAFNGGVK